VKVVKLPENEKKKTKDSTEQGKRQKAGMSHLKIGTEGSRNNKTIAAGKQEPFNRVNLYSEKNA